MKTQYRFRRGWSAVVLAAGLGAAMAIGTAPASAAAPPSGTIRNAGGPSAVADSYLVVFKDAALAATAVPDRADAVATRAGGQVRRTYRHALRGFEVAASAAAAQRIAADPSVAYVEQNHRVTVSGTQTPTPSWGLDRIDQRALPLNNSFTYPSTGSGVRAYIIDTGIRFSHTNFGGRAVSGFDAVDGGTAADCDGHGTHVAGTVGGSLYGVAKAVTLVAVRVLDCEGSGTYAGVLSGIDWVTGDHDPGELAVANMSLGGPADDSINTAVANSIADGVVYAVAAGNEYGDACEGSPASAPAAITVAATGGTSGSSDARPDFSNYGTCVDIFAPGVNITSSTIDSDTSSAAYSGTSMASPHVAGAAALVLAQNPSFTPQQVRDSLVGSGTTGVVTNPGPGSPNVLLYVADAAPPANDFSLSVGPAAGSTEPGGSVTATVSTATTAGTAQPVALSANGLPTGATATANPATVTSGGSSTLTISTATSTPPGTYAVTVTGTSAFATRSAVYTLTVTAPPGCSATNATDTSIPDLGTADSPITISGCPVASTASAVTVHIVHPYQGDLVVSLVAPDGSGYLLRGQSGGGTDNIDETYRVNLSGEAPNGTWRLRVQDAAAADVGYLDSWTLDLTGSTPPPQTCSGTNTTHVSIPDLGTADSPITISGCSAASSASSVEVHIWHPYQGDLTVALVAPDGTVYPLRDRTGGAADNIDETYRVNLSGEAPNGTWRLRVQDLAFRDVGYIDRWTLTL